MVIKRTPGFEVVGEATSGEDSVTMAMDLHPDLMLMDINMGAMSGIDATREIVAESPHTVVFLCSERTTFALRMPGRPQGYRRR